MFRKAPDFSISAETKIGTATFDLYLPNQHTPSVPDIDTIPTSTVHVAENVTLDSIRCSSVCISENTAIGQIGSIMFPEHAVSIYRSGATVVCTAVAVDEVGVCDVDSVLIWGEAETVWPSETVCYHSNIASGGVEAVD